MSVKFQFVSFNPGPATTYLHLTLTTVNISLYLLTKQKIQGHYWVNYFPQKKNILKLAIFKKKSFKSEIYYNFQFFDEFLNNLYDVSNYPDSERNG